MILSEETVASILTRTWQPVGNSAALAAGSVMGCTLLQRELVIARYASGALLAADAACPHKGANLARGCIKEGMLMCPYHGWRFAPDGACQSIPSLLEPSPEKMALAHLRNYLIRERYGFIWVKLEDVPLPNGRRHELPDVPEFEDPRWSYRLGPPMHFGCGWRREVENYLDMTHFAFAHQGTLGVCADPRIRDLKVSVLADGGYQMDAPFPALDNQHEMPGKLQSAHQRMQRGWLPNFTIIRQTFPDGDERVLLHVPSPHGTDRCTCYWSLAISPGFRGPPPEAQIAFAIRVLDEDRQMCELQIPREVPINPERGGWGVLVMPGDTLATTFQKQLRRWLTAESSAGLADLVENR